MKTSNGMNKIANKNKNISNGTRKSVILVLLSAFLFFAVAGPVSAYYTFSWKFFGGKIIDTEARDVRELKDYGYVCDSFSGTSIEITPVGSPLSTPTSYFIPFFVHMRSKNKTAPAIGQWIIGIYSGKSTVTCVNEESEDIQTVDLDTITLFGTSSGMGA